MDPLSNSIAERVLYEDNHLIAVNKLPSEITQGDITGDTTLPDLVKEYIRNKYNKPGNVFLGVIHRLDRPVSGAVLFARTSKALSRTNELIKQRQLEKTYLAIVQNKPEQNSGHLIHYLKKNEKQNKSYVVKEGTPGAKRAELRYSLEGSSDRYHLLRVKLITGRHHQIRVQLSAMGCPVKGDLKYGSPRSNPDGSIHLHALRVSMEHPVRKEELSIKAPPPASDRLWGYFKRTWSLIAALILIAQALPAWSQYHIYGQDPSGISWKQIDSPNFRLIFPEEYRERAAYIADILEYSYDHGSATLGHRPRSVPVIIHNRTVVPNGFVSWAPARLEMFTNPPPDNDPHGWLERLAVHEFRHVVQIDKLNQGLTGLFSKVFGEHATGVALGLFMPLWFLEGDAVAVETALTYGGRGRQPGFEQGLRAQVLEREIYPYDKAKVGSLRDHVPNHYELGYQLVASARAEHGGDVWDGVIDNIARRPYTVKPLSLALKKITGHSVRSYYKMSMQRLDSIWSAQERKHEYTPFSVINPGKELFTNYRPIAFRDDSTMLALKTGMKDIPRVVLLSLEGEEEVLFTPGFYNSEVFSLGGDIVAWSEIRMDPRWIHRSWSEIHTFNMSTGKRQKITRGTRYFSPSVSPGGSRIAVTEVTSLDEYSLLIIDTENGNEIFRLSLPGNAYLMQPGWHPGGVSVVLTAQDGEGKRIISVDTENGNVRTLFHAGHTDISRPRYTAGGNLVFNGAFSGIENIYLLDTGSGEAGKLVSSRFGAVDAITCPGDRAIAWSDYTSLGYNAVVSETESLIPKPLAMVEDHSAGFHRVLAAQETGLVSEEKIPRNEYIVSDYSKLRNLFNFHSWGPYSVNVDNQEINPGLSVFSQNHLSTSVLAAGYKWDVNEKLGEYYADYSYAGHYPVMNISASSGRRRSYYTEEGATGRTLSFLWKEHSVRAGAILPLNFRRGHIFYGLTPSSQLSISQALPGDDAPENLVPNNVISLRHRLSGHWQVRSVARDLRPRWGQVLDLHYRHTPFSGYDAGSVFALRFTSLFPGLAKHHSLRLAASLQSYDRPAPRPDEINFFFPNLIVYPRGVTGRLDERALVFSADYAFPLAYPDWVIPSLLYITRFHVNLFADHANVSYRENVSDPASGLVDQRLQSFGADFVSRLHPFSFFAPFDVGLRTIYLPGEDEFEFRLLFSFQI